MTATELARRQERAEHETFVIARTEDGFRVYAPGDPKRRYTVSEDEDGVHCTCPDFQTHQDDPGWRCKHILAVEGQFRTRGNGETPPDSHEREERQAIQEENREPRKRRAATPPTTSAQMILKRSVSPDGRIDALSVEFATPVSGISTMEITSTARKMLGAQAAIITEFLAQAPKPNGQKPNGNGTPREDKESPAAPARVVGVGGMDGKWGRRLFLTIECDGRNLHLFGNRKQLAEHLTAAGWRFAADDITEGVDLDVPCRVVTKPSPDGRYTNVERLVPAERVRL